MSGLVVYPVPLGFDARGRASVIRAWGSTAAPNGR